MKYLYNCFLACLLPAVAAAQANPIPAHDPVMIKQDSVYCGQCWNVK